MRCCIESATDLGGAPKEPEYLGCTVDVLQLKISCPALLLMVGGEFDHKVLRTSPVKSFGTVADKLKVTTRNSVYTLRITNVGSD